MEVHPPCAHSILPRDLRVQRETSKKFKQPQAVIREAKCPCCPVRAPGARLMSQVHAPLPSCLASTLTIQTNIPSAVSASGVCRCLQASAGCTERELSLRGKR